MFSSLKKNKTLRSLLGATALFMAGTPQVVEAAPKAPQKAAQTVQSVTDCLVTEYMPLCAQLEGNLPYCYKDKGVVTAGAGVHLKDYAGLGNLEAVKLTLKKGTVFNLEKLTRLRKMADADWKDPKIAALFPEVAKVEKIKLENCSGDFPEGTDKKWDKEQLIIIPSKVSEKINRKAADFCVKKAYEYHPNLFQLPPSARLVVVDLIYNLGYEKYFNKYLKFKAAVQSKDLATMKKECKTKNARRDTIRGCLINAALVIRKDPKITRENLLKQIRPPVVAENPKLAPALEKVLWGKLDVAATQDFNWYKTQAVRIAVARNSVSLKK